MAVDDVGGDVVDVEGDGWTEVCPHAVTETRTDMLNETAIARRGGCLICMKTSSRPPKFLLKRIAGDMQPQMTQASG